MLIKPFQVMFAFILMTGTIIAVSANSWFTSWLGLEINLMSMIPLILNKLNSKNSEASIKYFLVQAMASLVMIFFSMLSLELNETSFLEVSEILIGLAMALKAGMAPLHFWFPQVISKLEWTICLVLFTWQKIAPLILLISLNFSIIMFITIMSATIGSLGGLNQNELKMILTYSSIAHSGWMLMSCLLNFNTWFLYFTIYATLSSSIIIFLQKSFVSSKINEMNLWNSSTMMKTSFVMNFMSLAGLPPFLGFTAKLMVMQMMINLNLMTIFVILILGSVVSLYFYSRTFYSMLLMKKNNLSLSPQNPLSQYLLVTLSVTMNILVPGLIILT